MPLCEPPGHRPTTRRAAAQVGHFGGISDEIEALRRDKNVLMVELVRLRQQQAQSDHEMRLLHVRIGRPSHPGIQSIRSGVVAAFRHSVATGDGSGVSALRTARLPVNLIGSPISYANRLIGSPITSQSTAQAGPLLDGAAADSAGPAQPLSSATSSSAPPVALHWCARLLWPACSSEMIDRLILQLSTL